MNPTASPSTEPSSSKSLFCWRTARRALLALAILATLVALFYTEENSRGKHAWENCKRELEAQGMVFDWSTRIPPPVPDDQNFFKAPRMTEWFVGRGTNDLVQRLTNPKTSTVGSATNAIQTAADARDYLAWSDRFLPDFDRIRTALKRPCARIECDYSRPMTVLAPNFFTIRIVVQTLAQRSRSFLLLEEPDKALRELTLMHDLCRILESAPTGKPITLVAAMINVAVADLYASSIAEGLQMHAWREPQLSALGRQLGEIHLAPSIAETFIDEPMFSLRTLETSSRAELVKLLPEWGNSKKMALALKYAPQGWVDQNMATHARLGYKFSEGLDVGNETVSPRKIDEAGRELQHNLDHPSPYTFLTSAFMPSWVKAMQRFARNQTSVNEVAVACALERYHLAHGDYPESLDALAPQFVEKFPHDLVGGQPLKYRRTTDGQFVLYSIGWNESDDGGTAGKSVADGDWVWNDWVWRR